MRRRTAKLWVTSFAPALGGVGIASLIGSSALSPQEADLSTFLLIVALPCLALFVVVSLVSLILGPVRPYSTFDERRAADFITLRCLRAATYGATGLATIAVGAVLFERGESYGLIVAGVGILVLAAAYGNFWLARRMHRSTAAGLDPRSQLPPTI